MSGRSTVRRRLGGAVEAALLPGEQRRAAAVLRGPGPVGGLGAEPSRDSDWFLAVTDRRILVLSLGAGGGSTTSGPTSGLQSYPLDGVRVVDATLRGVTPVLVLQFPDAVVGWFHPLPAWRTDTEVLVNVLLGRAAEREAEAENEAYPEETLGPDHRRSVR